MMGLLENLLNLREEEFEYGDFITLKPDAEVSLSYKEGSPPRKWIIDGGLWAVDGYEEESGMLNVNRVLDPYPGAFCSFVHEDDVEKVISSAEYRKKRYYTKESSIDFPQEDLPKNIWKKVGDSYTIRSEVKDLILSTLGRYTEADLVGIAKEIHITGSIGTNQFTSDVDIDVHLIIGKSELPTPEATQKAVFKFFREEENITYFDEHPIEVYIQLSPDQELLADAVYDMLNDKWIKGPKIVPLDYDPYDDFSGIMKDVEEIAREADISLGELKRDIIDYTVIENALQQLPAGQKIELLGKLSGKLDEIEKGIDELCKTKKEWILMRKRSSQPTSPEQALKDVELVKSWRSENAKFKFLNRYQYMKIISALEKLIEDEEISPEEMEIVKNIVGVDNE